MRKVAVITGGGRGIGKAVAVRLAKEGMDVVIAYLRDKQSAEETEQLLRRSGNSPLTVQCDVSKESDVSQLMRMVQETYGHIDVLVNNAGIAIDAPLLERTTNQWLSTLKTNLLSVYYCSRYVAPYMLNQKQGTIINISSTSALYAFEPGIADYDASKAGIITLTKNFAKELAPYVRVNAIAPGWVDTAINEGLAGEYLAKQTESIYMNRFAQPEEIAGVCAFLAGPDASYITGTTIIADGGHD